MSPTLYAAFVAASVGLLLLPGPNVALIVGTSLTRGVRAGLAAVAGTTLAMIPQLALAVLGAGVLLSASAAWFEALRWLGVAYLLWLAVAAWRAPAPEASPPVPVRRIVLRGFLVSLTNPKTLLFYGAFLPQFVEPGPGATGLLALLAATFVVLALLVDSTWAVLAWRVRGLAALPGRLRNRIGAAFVAGAGLGLALTRGP
ncbi:LysE family translocator [Methylobacterium sp. NEAU 140]|uniref:LysE family translocator n=1 Tax=Methylobacterium sp. NEAU 140 TaxID=3064945 RepID=UPI002734F34D|nr:LysE family translocator [Methylobacterium sp. NEAU 140]MDP4023256.1 LysE family translocator [Methylobacterium sp. NEAU 140]